MLISAGLSRKIFSATACLSALAVVPAHAGTAAFIATPIQTLSQEVAPGSLVNLAGVFTANSNIVVDSLGVWNDPGFIAAEPVALYEYTTQTLLASTTVTTSDTLINGFLYHSIAPVTLLAGHQYEVNAFTNGNSWTFGPYLTTDARITFNAGLYNWTNQLAFSSTQGGAYNYYGPNFTIANTAAVPESETYAMLLAGLGVLGGLARRRRTQ